MKKLLLPLLFITFSAVAQSDLPRLKKPRQSTVDKDVWDITNNQGFWIHYVTPKEAQQLFAAEAKLKLYNQAQYQAEQTKIPAGGWLETRLVGGLQQANQNNLVFIIQDETGNEMERVQLESRVPQPISFSTGSYRSDIIVPLKAPIGNNYRVFVVNEAKRVRHEFLIRPL